METTPLVVDGVLYAVQNSEVVALDAATGRSFWTFRYRVPPESNAYLMVVKGLAISGDRLFWATYDGHLIAIDAKTGKSIWNRTLVDWKKGLQFNVAPLVVKDKVILGPAANEFGVNCWIAAFDVRTGKQVWRFNTVAGARRARQRDVAGRLVEARRRADLGDRLLRSGNEPDVLGHRQPESRLDRQARETRATTSTPTRSLRSTPTPGS